MDPTACMRQLDAISEKVKKCRELGVNLTSGASLNVSSVMGPEVIERCNAIAQDFDEFRQNESIGDLMTVILNDGTKSLAFEACTVSMKNKIIDEVKTMLNEQEVKQMKWGRAIGDQVAEIERELRVMANDFTIALGSVRTHLVTLGAKHTKASEVSEVNLWNERCEAVATAIAGLANVEAAECSVTDLGSMDLTDMATLDDITKNTDKLEDIRKKCINSVYAKYTNSVAVRTSKIEYKRFPVPSKIDKSRHKEVLQSILTWAKSPATIREYWAIVGDIIFMCNVYDHALGKHQIADYGMLRSDVKVLYTDEVKAAVDTQWKDLYGEIKELCKTDEQKKFYKKLYKDGIVDFKFVRVDDQDGMHLVYAILCHHVSEKISDTKTVEDALAGIPGLFVKGSSVASAIESARSDMQKALEFNIFPSYARVGRSTITALKDMDVEIFSAVNKAQDEYIETNGKPTADCSALLEVCFEAALEEYEAKQDLEDTKQQVKRKRGDPEAKAEVTALITQTAPGLNKQDVNNIKSKMGMFSEMKTGSSSYKRHVKACALLLNNGQKLTEPAIRSQAKDLHKPYKGGPPKGSPKGGSTKGGRGGRHKGGSPKGGSPKGGRGGRGGGSERSHDNNGRGGLRKDDVNDYAKVEQCRSLGCKQHSQWNYKSNCYFQFCSDCAHEFKTVGGIETRDCGWIPHRGEGTKRTREEREDDEEKNLRHTTWVSDGQQRYKRDLCANTIRTMAALKSGEMRQVEDPSAVKDVDTSLKEILDN